MFTLIKQPLLARLGSAEQAEQVGVFMETSVRCERWSTTWGAPGHAARCFNIWFWALVIPGVPLFISSLIEGSNSWVMNFSQMIGVFLFFPYALVVSAVFLFSLLSGAAHSASLSFSRGVEGDLYRAPEATWRLEGALSGEAVRSLEFSPRELEGFAREPLSDGDVWASWYRVVLLLKRREPLVIFARVPESVSRASLLWLCHQTQTSPAPGSEPL